MFIIVQHIAYEGSEIYGIYSTKELAEKELDRLSYHSSDYTIEEYVLNAPATFESWKLKETSSEVSHQGPYYDGDPGIRKVLKSDLVLDPGLVYKDANIETIKLTSNWCNCNCGGCQEGEE